VLGFTGEPIAGFIPFLVEWIGLVGLARVIAGDIFSLSICPHPSTRSSRHTEVQLRNLL
jgi:hypothetical protein